jgi:O-antigen ligase
VPSAATSRYFYAAASLLAAALLLGGGGTTAPVQALLIELVALGVLILLAWRGVHSPRRDKVMLAGVLLLLLIVITPLAQLIPLPHAVWSRLPGRELAVSIDGLLNSARGWRPLSLDPEATWLSALYLLAPAAMFLITLQLVESDRRKLMAVAVACAFVSAAIGLLQVAGSGSVLSIYGGTHSAFPTGLFVNRNHQADFQLIAMILCTALLAQTRRFSPFAQWGLSLAAITAFTAAVIATTSRMGFILLPIALLTSLSMLTSARIAQRRIALAAAAGAVLIAAGLVALSKGTRLTLQRFDTMSDLRLEFWSDAWFAARQYFPWGSGIGTFDPVYRSIENLNQVGPAYVNLAHNDYLQILIEAGLWGCILICFFLGLFGWLAVRRIDARFSIVRRAAASSILILLLHSAVDYPLRMLSLLTLAGFLGALLYPHGAARSGTRQSVPKAV